MISVGKVCCVELVFSLCDAEDNNLVLSIAVVYKMNKGPPFGCCVIRTIPDILPRQTKLSWIRVILFCKQIVV